MLKKESTRNVIESIQTSKGNKVFTTPEIAGIFQEYYGRLYAISQNDPPEKAKRRSEYQKKFLEEAGLKKIPVDKLSFLKTCFLQEFFFVF